jgi:hypothetical protein
MRATWATAIAIIAVVIIPTRIRDRHGPAQPDPATRALPHRYLTITGTERIFVDMSACTVGAVIELPINSEPAARRAMQRGGLRLAVKVLREKLGYIGAALALEIYIETLREQPRDDEYEPDTAVVDIRELS